MSLRHRLTNLWRNFTRKRQVEDDLDGELRSFQALLEDEKIAAGVDPAVARREALLDLGGIEQIKDEVRDVRLGTRLEAIGTELRQSLRGLRRNPGLSVVGTSMLALGMAASTVVFSIFYAALVQPLPFREAERVVQLWETRQDRDFDRASFTAANFWDVRAQNRAFVEVGAYRYDEANLTGNGPAEKVSVVSVSAGFFRTLGVTPVLGRDFSYDVDRAGPDREAVMIGHRFWQSRFGGDRGILGRPLRLNERSYIVVGVLPPGEPWLDEQFYIPFAYRPDANRRSWEFDVIARLKPGVSAAAARTDLQRVAGTLGQAYPREDRGIGFRLESSSTWVARDNTRRALWVLLAAVTLLLLIGCFNIANMLLARGLARQREIAMRIALGASRGRLIRFVMMESLLLSLFGAALGLALAYSALRAIRSLEVSGVPRIAEAGLNPWVLGFAVVIALLTGIFAGLAPALQAPASAIAATIRDGDRQTGSRKQGRLRSALVTAEVALSFLLLVGAGLLIRSFVQLVHVPQGFQTENRLVFSVSLPGSYWQKGVGKQFLDRFFERLSTAPGVVAAGAVSHRPVEGGDPGMSIDSDSRPKSGAPPWAGWRIVSPGYFRAIGLPLLRGRMFDERDPSVWAEPGDPVPSRRVIITERLAKRIFPNEDPVGKRASLWSSQQGMDAEVIGVVGDSRERGPAAQPTLTVFLPYGRNALTTEFVVHTKGNPRALLPNVRAIVAGLDPDLPVSDVRSFEEVVNRSVASQRLSAILLAIFGGLALLLATIGIYGVLSYTISRRTAEIGLRVALGASNASILRLAVGQGMRPALLGMAMGALGAWWLSRYLTSLLFEVKPFDLLTYMAVAALLMSTAAAACYLPGRRAMRTDPAIALRSE